MGILCPAEDAGPWVPRSQKQMSMTAKEIEVDNYCREVLNNLNKATPQNVDSLLDKMANLKLDNEFSIIKLVMYIVCKAEAEPLYGEVYAEMCATLNQVVDRSISSASDESADTGDISFGIFRMLIIKECLIAFDEVFNYDRLIKNNDTSDLHIHRQKMFGIMHFIGQLYNVEFFHDETLMKIINKLLEKTDTFLLEFQVECLCKLIRVIGATIECERRKDTLNQCFKTLETLCSENDFCSRVRFGIMDLIELRHNNWVARRAAESPMTIDELRSTFVNPNPSARGRKKKKKKQKN